MACQPSSTFLCVASSTSKGGTIWPAGMASILTLPCVSLSTRSAKCLKCSCSVLLAGQVDCILSVREAGAGVWATAPKDTVAAAATAMRRFFIWDLPVDVQMFSLLDVGAKLNPPRLQCQ